MNTNIFNNSGAFKDLFNNLQEKSIHRFNSINEIIHFKKNHHNEIANYKNRIKIEIKEEIIFLKNEKECLINEYTERKAERNSHICNQIEQLKTTINYSNNNFFLKIKKYFSKRKLNFLESNLNKVLEKPFKRILSKIENIEKKIKYLQNNQNEEIEIRSKSVIKEIQFINTELENLNSLIYGSIGELYAIELFKKLPEKYYIINDYRRSFNPPIYNKREGDRIYSTQIDHIVIGPTGIYVIETKYWNHKSIKSNELFSPIKQLRRSGFAFFIILNDYIRKERSSVFYSNWGQTKVSVYNILLMMNSSTNEQFQFVKILSESDFINYITRRPVILTEDQIKYIVNIIT